METLKNPSLSLPSNRANVPILVVRWGSVNDGGTLASLLRQLLPQLCAVSYTNQQSWEMQNGRTCELKAPFSSFLSPACLTAVWWILVSKGSVRLLFPPWEAWGEEFSWGDRYLSTDQPRLLKVANFNLNHPSTSSCCFLKHRVKKMQASNRAGVYNA